MDDYHLQTSCDLNIQTTIIAFTGKVKNEEIRNKDTEYA